jgi:hypothetical protein
VKGSGGEAIIAALLTRDVATVGTCRRLIAGSYRGREAPMSFVCKLVVFSTQYGIAAHLSLRPEARANLIVAGHAVPDATVGYFVGLDRCVPIWLPDSARCCTVNSGSE